MSLIETRLLAFRSQPDIDKWEVRVSNYGAFDLVRRQTQSSTGIITEDLKAKALKAINTPLQIPVLQKEDFTIQNISQPLVVAGAPGTSALYTVVFVDYYFGFRMFPAMHENNEISMQREWNRKLKGYTTALMATLDETAVALLEANKSQVLADDFGRYSFVGDTVLAPFDEGEYVLGDIDPLMGANDFMGRTNIVQNFSMDSHIRRILKEEGTYNQKDKTYQYANKNFCTTPRIPNAEGTRATFFAVQDDSVGYVQQFSPDVQIGSKTHNHVWSKGVLPVADIEIGLYEYDGAIDGTALAGDASTHLTATKMEAYGFHTRIAMIHAYNSDPAAIASPTLKVAIQNPV